MQDELLKRQLPVEIHVVQVHKREHSRVRGSAIQVQLDIDAFKFTLQAARYQPACPLVEITHDQPRVFQARGHKDLAAYQHMRLFAALQITGAQMDVEEMDNLARSHLDIAADATARLAPGCGEIVDFRLPEWKAAQDNVAVGGAAQLTGFTDAELEANRVRQILCLVLLAAVPAETDYLLQRDDVGLEFAQDLGNPRR